MNRKSFFAELKRAMLTIRGFKRSLTALRERSGCDTGALLHIGEAMKRRETRTTR